MKTLLVVDDEFDLTNTLRAVFQSAGYRVDTATDGGQAMNALRSHVPDLVLMDVMMPLMDGLKVLRTMRQSHDLENVPVILMSVLPPTVKREDYDWQAFLRKPFTLETLLKTVEQTIGTAEPRPQSTPH